MALPNAADNSLRSESNVPKINFVSPPCYLYHFDSGITFVTPHFRGMIYGFVSMFTSSKYEGFTFQKSLLFGSLISATDPGLFLIT